jgi:hypothetical protein
MALGPPRSTARLLLGVLALLALKLSALIWLGPTMMPDSAGYIAYADAILTGSFKHVDLVQETVPVVLARPIGYPAIIAAAKIVAGAGWSWVVVLLQLAASIGATVMVYRLARLFALGRWAALGVAAAQATAMQFVVDQAIISDSLCASAMTIAACMSGAIILRRAPPPLRRFLGIGALIAAAFLLRDVTWFLAIGFVPMAAAAAMTQPSSWRKCAAFALVFLPLVLAHRGYVEWNRSRVGAGIVTTVSQWTLLDALGNASQFDPTIFSGAAPIDAVGRRVFKSFEIGAELDAAFEANDILHREYGWSAVRIAHEVTSAYLQAWQHHPLAMVRHVLVPLTESQLHQAVRPTETVRDLLLWRTGEDHDFARERAVRDGNWWMIPAVIAHRLAETLSVGIFAAFVLITPLRLWRQGPTAETCAAAGLWFSYVVLAGLYAAVHLEPRYLIPVVAGSIVVGTANIAWIAGYRGRARAKPGSAATAGG